MCAHMTYGGLLAHSKLEDYEVECPWHQSEFDVKTGEMTNPPATESEPTSEIKVDGNSTVRETSNSYRKEQPQHS
jgi:nitrite reductase/ring-hydroxylating ferredoxin subunit